MTSSGTIRTGGAVVERCVYSPYGEVNVMQGERDQGGSVSGFGDRDGDEDERSECERAAIGKASRHARVRPARRPGGSEHEVSDRRVDSTDKGTVGTTCTGTVTGECRILDLDFDGDYDATDAGFFDYLPQGVGRHPGKFASGVDQPFHHQGLLFEPEVRQYQNRARQYDPGKKRFVQRDMVDGYEARAATPLSSDGLNLFLYLLANPQLHRDPYGLQVEGCDCERLCFGTPSTQFAKSSCCGTTPQWCWCRRPSHPVTRKCVQKHEECHLKHFNCQNNTSSGWAYPTVPYQEGWDPNRSECECYKVQIQCMCAAGCDGLFSTCRADLRAAAEYARSYCALAGERYTKPQSCSDCGVAATSFPMMIVGLALFRFVRGGRSPIAL